MNFEPHRSRVVHQQERPPFRDILDLPESPESHGRREYLCGVFAIRKGCHRFPGMRVCRLRGFPETVRGFYRACDGTVLSIGKLRKQDFYRMEANRRVELAGFRAVLCDSRHPPGLSYRRRAVRAAVKRSRHARSRERERRVFR